MLSAGLFGAVTSAMTNLIVRRLVGVHTMVTVSYLMGAAAVVSGVWAAVTQAVVIPNTAFQWVALLAICFFGFGGQMFKTQVFVASRRSFSAYVRAALATA